MFANAWGNAWGGTSSSGETKFIESPLDVKLLEQDGIKVDIDDSDNFNCILDNSTVNIKTSKPSNIKVKFS